MTDLRVEKYDLKEVTAKKQSLSKHVAMVGGTAILALGLFGLVGCIEDGEHVGKQNNLLLEQQRFPPDDIYIMGGSGSWFVSILERA